MFIADTVEKMEDDADGGFDTRSEASSDHHMSDEPSMSEASRASSITRESSGISNANEF